MEDINKIKLAPNDLRIESLTRHEVKLLDDFAYLALKARLSSQGLRESTYLIINANEYCKTSYQIALCMIAERRKIIE